MKISRPRGLENAGTGQKGFTLLETIVALTVLAISLVAILQTYLASAKTLNVSDHYFNALVLSRSLMTEEKSRAESNVRRRTGGYGALRWRVDTRMAHDQNEKIAADAPWRLYRITVVVDWPGGKGITLRSLKLGRPYG